VYMIFANKFCNTTGYEIVSYHDIAHISLLIVVTRQLFANIAIMILVVILPNIFTE
jgi:hypothetical protein